jgi:tetratricopeptide (TPR) repeat protein
LGWVYYRRSDFPGAKAQLEKAEDYLKDGQKDNAVVYDHLGEVFLKLGDKESALLQWQRAAQLDPDNKDYPVKISKVQTNP